MSRSRKYKNKKDESYKRDRAKKRKDAEEYEKKQKETERALVKEYEDYE